jgi:predicted neutral ceramidase superfamily lipid hydrolase
LKTDIRVEPTFYLLFVASLVLAVLNTFIMKATSQYMDELNNVNIVITNDQDLLEEMMAKDTTNQVADVTKDSIDIVPLQFTDRFRWILRRIDNNPDSISYFETVRMENECGPLFETHSIRHNRQAQDDSDTSAVDHLEELDHIDLNKH